MGLNTTVSLTSLLLACCAVQAEPDFAFTFLCGDSGGPGVSVVCDDQVNANFDYSIERMQSTDGWPSTAGSFVTLVADYQYIVSSGGQSHTFTSSWEGTGTSIGLPGQCGHCKANIGVGLVVQVESDLPITFSYESEMCAGGGDFSSNNIGVGIAEGLYGWQAYPSCLQTSFPEPGSDEQDWVSYLNRYSFYIRENCVEFMPDLQYEDSTGPFPAVVTTAYGLGSTGGTLSPGQYSFLVFSNANTNAYGFTASPGGSFSLRIDYGDVGACPADLNGDGSLNFFDVSAFLELYIAQDPSVDLNDDGQWNFFDVSQFLVAYNEGCP